MPTTLPLLAPLSSRQAMDWQPNSLRRTVANLALNMQQIFFDLASDAVPGFMYVNTLDLSEAQFEALAAPVTMVPAPGPDKTIIPILLVFSGEFTTAYGNNPLIRLRFNGDANDMVTSRNIGSAAINRAFTLCFNTQPTIVSPPDPPVNKAIELSLSSNVTLPGTGVIINCRFQLLYTIANTPVGWSS